MTLLMIRPVRFGYNAQTATNNAFQQFPREGDAAAIQQQALEEFDAFVEKLRQHDIDVLVMDDSAEPYTPDSIFPNNWVSFHRDGTLVLYPMFAENRRLERKPAVIDAIKERFAVSRQIDLSSHEVEGRFLEGTGSFVLDRENGMAYACRSPRTDEQLFRYFCRQLGYTPVIFDAVDRSGTAIYHTNVMMCIADRYAVINLDAVALPDRTALSSALKHSGKAIVAIDHDQMDAFAGNMLQVENKKGQRYLVMSSQALGSLRPEQVSLLESFNPIIHSPLDTIERNGGGSARCMMAEVYLPHQRA
ncbi:citrulline utilization hydrolase CtlX [Parapedobacter soli]|uniref:citrulline utilization hydrolase CtlX n=1 Tax=Parapedobacter soli TaxID=416955 RepID=UPI0021C8F5EA|nr:arginine deiminase-related protein [Parapedobacter soli]